MTDWSAIDLCSDADVLKFEATFLSATANSAHWRASAKEEIERRLRYNFRDLELATTATDVLDLITNPDVLARACACKAIELCAVSNITMQGDAWSEKARIYAKKFDEEFELALGMLIIDKDESGAADDSEKYGVSGGVRITRGGGLPSATNVGIYVEDNLR